ncbi:hypothetical protein [uncultured Campylobacter sp.]|nr:hypothetical protein [uncultured Campylobacter sp.]
MKFYYDRIPLKIFIAKFSTKIEFSGDLNFIKVKFYRIEILSQ